MIALPPGACVVSDPLRAPTAGAFRSSLPSLSLSPVRLGAHAMCSVRQLGAAMGIPGAGGDSCSLGYASARSAAAAGRAGKPRSPRRPFPRTGYWKAREAGPG